MTCINWPLTSDSPNTVRLNNIDKILLSEMRTHAAMLAGVVSLMLLAIGFDVLAPWPYKILIDNVLTTAPSNETGLMAFLMSLFKSRYLLGVFAVLLYFLSNFLNTVFEYVKSVSTKLVIKRVTSHFTKRAFKNLESMAIGFYKDQEIGDYIYRLSYDVSALGEFLEYGLLPIVSALAYLLVTIFIMLAISVKLALFALAAVPFLAIGVYVFNEYISEATDRSETINSAVFSFIEEALTHLRIIQAFSQERAESLRFNVKTDSLLGSDMLLYRLDFMLTLLIGIVIAVSYSIVILYGMNQVFAGTLTTGLLIVFIFYLDNLTNPLLNIIYASSTMRSAYVKVRRMEDFFNVKTHLPTTVGRRHLAGIDIRFDNVTVEGREGKKMLKNVNFTIAGGKRTVILGVSGSGKTSIANLILRFLEKPTHGKVSVGGIDISEYELKLMRDAIAYVPQEVTLFDDTVHANIAFGSAHATLSEIKQAARMAHAEDFINRLPNKYNFRVGEGGMLLSGGQRQRIMLARAFMKKQAKILLFDETFSALDVKTRKEVLAEVCHFSRGKTTIMISNVFEVMEVADNVVVLNRGEIIYSGPASHLPREVSLYKMIMQHD